jgi:hypothetical protein
MEEKPAPLPHTTRCVRHLTRLVPHSTKFSGLVYGMRFSREPRLQAQIMEMLVQYNACAFYYIIIIIIEYILYIIYYIIYIIILYILYIIGVCNVQTLGQWLRRRTARNSASKRKKNPCHCSTLPPCQALIPSRPIQQQRRSLWSAVLGGAPSEAQIMATLVSVAKAVQQLHKAGFMHGNVHMSTVVWSESERAWVLLDSGLHAKIGAPYCSRATVGSRSCL